MVAERTIRIPKSRFCRTLLLTLNPFIAYFHLLQAICVKDISPNLKSCELLRDGTGTFQCKADVFLTLDSLDCLSAWVPIGPAETVLVLHRAPGALLWKRKIKERNEGQMSVWALWGCRRGNPGHCRRLTAADFECFLLFKKHKHCSFYFALRRQEYKRKKYVWEMLVKTIFFPDDFPSLLYSPLLTCIKCPESWLQSRFPGKYFYLFYLLKWTNTDNLLCGYNWSLNM